MFDMSNSYLFTDDIDINLSLNILINSYHNKNFITVNRILNTNKNIYNLYSSYIKSINCIRKFIYNRKLKKCKFINELTLNLSPIKDYHNKELFKLVDINNSAIYTFLYTELINLYKSRLNYLHFEYIIPKNICNPYTNKLLTTKNHIDIYFYLLKLYATKNKILPSIIIDFKNSKFDVFNYHSLNFINLYYSGYNIFINNLSFNEWKDELLNSINYYKSISKHFCYECSYKLYGSLIKTILNHFLIIHFLNINNIFNYGSADSICLSILKKANIFYSIDHNNIHHPTINIRRYTNTNEYDDVINISDYDSEDDLLIHSNT